MDWINDSSGDFDYQISNRPEKDWIILKEFPYSAWFGPSGHLYALGRPGGTLFQAANTKQNTR